MLQSLLGKPGQRQFLSFRHGPSSKKIYMLSQKFGERKGLRETSKKALGTVHCAVSPRPHFLWNGMHVLHPNCVIGRILVFLIAFFIVSLVIRHFDFRVDVISATSSSVSSLLSSTLLPSEHLYQRHHLLPLHLMNCVLVLPQLCLSRFQIHV